MKHGGDTISYSMKFDGELIDFSSNINPLGYPKIINTTVVEALKELTIYPDINYRALKEEISQYLGCSKGAIILGNGAVEIINNFSILFKRTVVFTPCFIEYVERPLVNGKEIVEIPLNEDFTIELEALKEKIRAGDLLILGNPNNPTGKRIPKELLQGIHSLVEEKNAFLLLDEAFYEFCEEDYDSIKLFRKSRNICVIRAATKFFALPGIRLGYGFVSQELVGKYNLIALPWNINSFANAVGKVIFKDYDYINSSKAYISLQRANMLAKLKFIKGIKVYETDSNFILLKLLKGNEDEVFEHLLSKGIMIRKASSFHGLDKSFIRVAIKSAKDNEYLLDCLGEYFLKREVLV